MARRNGVVKTYGKHKNRVVEDIWAPSRENKATLFNSFSSHDGSSVFKSSPEYTQPSTRRDKLFTEDKENMSSETRARKAYRLFSASSESDRDKNESDCVFIHQLKSRLRNSNALQDVKNCQMDGIECTNNTKTTQRKANKKKAKTNNQIKNTKKDNRQKKTTVYDHPAYNFSDIEKHSLVISNSMEAGAQHVIDTSSNVQTCNIDDNQSIELFSPIATRTRNNSYIIGPFTPNITSFRQNRLIVETSTPQQKTLPCDNIRQSDLSKIDCIEDDDDSAAGNVYDQIYKSLQDIHLSSMNNTPADKSSLHSSVLRPRLNSFSRNVTMRLSKERKSIRPCAIVEDNSRSVRPCAIAEDNSSSVRPCALVEDNSSSVRPCAIVEDNSSSVRPCAIVEDNSSSVRPCAVVLDKLTESLISRCSSRSSAANNSDEEENSNASEDELVYSLASIQEVSQECIAEYHADNIPPDVASVAIVTDAPEESANLEQLAANLHQLSMSHRLNCTGMTWREMLTPCKDRLSGIELTAREKVLVQCEQTDYITFSQCIPTSMMKKCVKIGEGVYGEVYRTQWPASKEFVALKIIPIEGSLIVNDEPQKKFTEIIAELVISNELSGLRYCDENMTENFIEVHRVSCVQGRYPAPLLKQWDIYHKRKGSENDRPDNFGAEQLFIMFEFADGGSDIDSFQFEDMYQAHSVLQQIACSLAIAEVEMEFEHRDLHVGNVLVKKTEERFLKYQLNGNEFEVETSGVKVSIIDFTMSRLYRDGCKVYLDLSEDKTLFEGEGDYQFDVYRAMKQHNRNEWSMHAPFTNVLWLHYISDKMMILKYPPLDRDNKAIRRNFKAFNKQALTFNSALDILQNCDFLKIDILL